MIDLDRNPKDPPAFPPLRRTSVALGRADDGSTVWLSDSQRETHVMATGISGSGKTQMAKSVLWQDLDRGACVVALDPIGSLVLPTIDRMREAALRSEIRCRSLPPKLAAWEHRRFTESLGRIMVLNFADRDFPWRLNLLEPFGGLTVPEIASMFASGVERVVQGDMAQTRQLLLNLTAIASVVAEAGGTVADMPALCCADTRTLSEFCDRVEQSVADGKLRAPVRRDILKLYFRSFFAQTGQKERRELIASTYRVLSLILSDPIVAKFISSTRSNLLLSDISNRGLSLLVHVPPNYIHTHAILSGFLLDCLSKLALRRTPQQVEEGLVPQVHVMIDEFQMVWTSALAKEIAYLRNRRLSFFLLHQTACQSPFETVEGRSLLQSARDNTSCRLFMRLGQLDAEEAAPLVFQPRGESMIRFERDEVTRTEGVSRTVSAARSVSRSISEAFAEGRTQSVSLSLGNSQTIAYSESRGIQRTETESLTLARGEGWCQAVSKSSGTSVTVAGSEILVEGGGVSSSRSLSEGRSESSSAGGSVGSWEGSSLSLGTGSSEADGRPAGAGMSTGISHGQSLSHGTATNLAETIGSVISKAASLARGRSRAESSSSSRSVSVSRSTSESRSEGQSIARGLSIALGCVESMGKTLTRGETTGRSQTATRSIGRSEGQTQTLSEGRSQGRSTKRVVELHSLSDETVLRSYELIDLPARVCWAVMRGAGPAERMKFRTLDVPQRFCTRLGPLDGAKLLATLLIPPSADPEPQEDIFERLRRAEALRRNGVG
jgi:hypothetical protein